MKFSKSQLFFEIKKKSSIKSSVHLIDFHVCGGFLSEFVKRSRIFSPFTVNQEPIKKEHRNCVMHFFEVDEIKKKLEISTINSTLMKNHCKNSQKCLY